MEPTEHLSCTSYLSPLTLASASGALGASFQEGTVFLSRIVSKEIILREGGIFKWSESILKEWSNSWKFGKTLRLPSIST